MSIAPVLRDTVIEIRPLTVDDAEAHHAGEDQEITRWLSGGASSRHTVISYLRACEREWRDDGALKAFGIHKISTGVMVGTVDVRIRQPYLAPGKANIAYGTHPAWRRRGIAVRAVLLAAQYVHQAEVAQELVIRTHPDNPASAAVAARAGFRYSHRTCDHHGLLDWYVRSVPTEPGR